MINEYQFGSIVINGKTYNHDVEVRWNDQVLDWWRKQSHIIEIEDIQKAIEQKPEIIIIGTGQSGIAKVTKETQAFIKEQDIELIIDITEQAVKTFNILKQDSKEEEGEQKKVIGFFHLTC